MKKDKECALEDYVEMIKKSWTFHKMTGKEQSDCILMFKLYTSRNAVKGTYEQRWEVLHGLYSSFLCALGYYDNCANWRD